MGIIVFFVLFADLAESRAIDLKCRRETARKLLKCREPEPDISYYQGNRHDSFLLLLPELPQTRDIRYSTNIQRTKIQGKYGFDQCAWQPGSQYNSTCPHHYVINYDKNRRPKTLVEAKCNCNLSTPCLGGAETSRCVPIKYYISVLRKDGCAGGVYTYTPTTESINVGCTCAYP